MTNEKRNYSVGVVIPTYHASKHLKKCVEPLLQSSVKPRILVIDSSSKDNTVEIAKQLGLECIVIPQTEFNHGLTRERGRKILNTDIVVMMTQDAYPVNSHMLEELIKPIASGQAAAAYARQLPHHGATFLESFSRHFNYPANSHIRHLSEIDQYGIYMFFCSNSCAAYLNRALDDIGGFTDALFGEDTVAVAKLLQRSYSIAYCASAQVRHSHDYSLKQEFFRHFDIGLARHSYKDLIAIGGKDSKRGKNFVKLLMKSLIKDKPFLIPYACLHIFAKLAGYKLGQASLQAPTWIKKRLSSQSYYWSNR